MMEEKRTVPENRSLTVYGECFGLIMLAFLNSIKFVAMLNKYLYLEDFIYKFDRWIFSRIYFIQQDYQDHFYGPLYIMKLGEAIKYYVF